jgi:F-type H+-transporting ATPase subunit b
MNLLQPLGVHVLCFIDLDATYFVQLVIVAIFLVLMHHLLFRPLLRVLDERRARTVGVQENAVVVKERAKEDIERYEAEIFAARNRRAEILAGFQNEGQAVCRKQAEEARRSFEARLEAGLASVEGQYGLAQREVEAQAGVLGGVIVERLVDTSGKAR